MRRVAPVLGIREWQRHESKYHAGGWYCVASVLGFDFQVARRFPGDDFSDRYEFYAIAGLRHAIVNPTAAYDGVVDAIARELFPHIPNIAIMEVDRKTKVPSLWKYRYHPDRTVPCSVTKYFVE